MRKPTEDEAALKKREDVKRQLALLNPNTDIPIPKRIMIRKAAIDMIEYDQARQLARDRGEEIKNLDEPADPVRL